jgi:hypothetical protein
MKKSLLFALSALFSPLLLIAQTSGGPDSYGYTWVNSDDLNGPTFDWVDISTIGTPVDGLTDDNASAFITMGPSFHYYWSDVTKIIVGSNGWLSFDQASNIAHCFPSIPSAGGAADHLLAPMMTDLLFGQAGTDAVAYTYHDNVNNRFIVSYIDVPWWSATAPGYIGLNTFQVILSSADSSITYQYLDMDQASLNDIVGCDQDLVIGIENVTGDIGLQVINEQVPADSFAIKFYYPEAVTFAIQDATPTWNQNPGNKGTFVVSGTDINLQTNIGNVGNEDFVDEIQVSGQLQSLNLVELYIDYDTIPSLTAGGSNTIVFSSIANLPEGQYFFNTSSTNPNDINPGNNQNVTEITAVDMNQPSFVLSHATQGFPDGAVAWTGGGGVGVFIKPPTYPVTLDSISVFINDGGLGAEEFTLEVYDDDSMNDAPGTVIATELVAAGSYTINTWVTVALSSPIEIQDGGIFLGWIHPGTSSVTLGTELAGPISNQSYEFVGGGWAAYRENATTEFLINGIFESECGNFTINTDNISDVSCWGANDGSIDISVNGGTPGYSYTWSNGVGAVEDPSGLNPGVYVLAVEDSLGCQTGVSVTINQPTEISTSATSEDEMAGDDGSIDLTVTGGTPPYSYLWDHGSINQDPSGLSSGDYVVTVTDANGCESDLSVTVASQVGILETEHVVLQVYPNPNNGSFILSGEFRSGDRFNVRDLIGNEVGFDLAHQNGQVRIDLNESATGVYFVNWTNGIQSGTAKLMVN